jgi:hypothetical protein
MLGGRSAEMMLPDEIGFCMQTQRLELLNENWPRGDIGYVVLGAPGRQPSAGPG